MMRLSSMVFSFALVSACTPGPEAQSAASGRGTCKNALPVTTTQGVRGVVLPSAVARRDLTLRRRDVESYWVPSEDDVRVIEASLGDALKERLASANKQPASSERDTEVAALTHITAHLGDYLRQYAGIVVNGARRVLINAFPEDTYCYRDQFIVVEDGGPQFFTIQYDVQLRQFLHWELTTKR